MNRRQIINKILHDHIEVNPNEDYTNYKKLITSIEEWHECEVKKLPISNVVGSEAELVCGHPNNKVYLKDGFYHCEECKGKWKSLTN